MYFLTLANQQYKHSVYINDVFFTLRLNYLFVVIFFVHRVVSKQRFKRFVEVKGKKAIITSCKARLSRVYAFPKETIGL